MAKVYYKRLLEGVTIPAVIHNVNYYYISMPLYEDGSMDCWKRIALSELISELKRGWLVTEVPIGENINIHGLGSYKILDAQWEHTSASYVEHIQKCVKSMNEEMTGLFQETKEQEQRWKKNRVSWGAQGKPYKIKNNFGYNLTDGDSTNVFYLKDNIWQVTTITAYSDESLSIDAIPDCFFSLDEIRAQFAAGKLCSNPKREIVISIPGLGMFTSESIYAVDSAEKLKEIENMANIINGRPSIHDQCKKIYFEYLIYPCNNNKERLREAYEAVPKHERMYLGDMDTKDSDFKRILYTDAKRKV